MKLIIYMLIDALCITAIAHSFYTNNVSFVTWLLIPLTVIGVYTTISELRCQQ